MSEASAASPWVAPEFSGGSGPMTANKLEALQKAAYEEAYASGLEEGRAAGRKELAERARYLDELTGYLSEPFRQLDEEVEQALTSLAVRIAEQVIRREVAGDPQHIVTVVKELIAMLPAAARSITVHLHPQDAATLRAAYAEAQAELTWSLVEEPQLAQGGVQVLTESSLIDASIEKRLDDILSGLLDAERDDDV